jgi:uncharacterized protein (DUF58 family)
MYREEKELSVFLLLDSSASMFASFASESGLSRYDQAVLAAALIAFSTDKAGQMIGALFFDSEVRGILKSGRGKSRTGAIIDMALNAVPRGRGSDLKDALSKAGSLLKRQSLVVVISDFVSTNWKNSLVSLCRKHDVICIRVCDCIDEVIPSVGMLTLCDPETGVSVVARSNSEQFKAAWAKHYADRVQVIASQVKSSGAAYLELSSDDDAFLMLTRFFGHFYSGH